ncbi:MAG TPA: hypothetical protein VJ741_09005 [Solirubrobacteraceae bacterium]|nr:hypothetical protein [Solirubrobacteraceae bacterium]
MSTQVADTVALVVSGPVYVVEAHEAMPENALAVGAPVTAPLYQPPESGGRDGTTVAVGEESSTWSV